MPRVPDYQPTTGARTPSSPMMSPEVAATPARGLGGVAETMGQTGNILVKLQEQRNIRLRNIQTLNLHSQYNDAVMQATTAEAERQGSDAIGSTDRIREVHKQLGKDFDSKIDDDLVREHFNALKSQTDEASLSHIAAHESRQFKVAQADVLENLIKQHSELAAANPNSAQVEQSLSTIGAQADLQFPPEKAKQIKDAAETAIKSNFILSFGIKNPKEAESYLNKWKESGTLDIQTYDTLKTKLKNQNDEATLDSADAVIMGKYKGNWAAMAHDVAVNYAKYGLNVKQAEQLSSRYEGHYNFDYSMEQRTKAQRADQESGFIFKAITSGDPKAISKALDVINTSTHMTDNQRLYAWQAINGIQSQSVLDDILSGKIKTKNEVLLATHNMGVAGKEVQKYFDNMQSTDNAAIMQSLALYNENRGKKGLHFKLSDDVFKAQLIAQINSKNIHGADIFEWAKKTIGYKEEVDWGRDVTRSNWAAWEDDPKAKNTLLGGKPSGDKKSAGSGESKKKMIIPETVLIIGGKQYGRAEDGEIYPVVPGVNYESGK